jgi:hypothetical protein
MAKTLDEPIDEPMVRALALPFGIVCMLALSATAAAYAALPGRSNVPADKTRELHVEADMLYTRGKYGCARVAYNAAWALVTRAGAPASSSSAPRLTPMLAPGDSRPSFTGMF